ncbi:hypothetical protein [Vreelandella azerica]|uniref:hypothetical protein n=1 Tax=Vreelandella azerica TaxID=2732867 RepID=UPI001F43D8CA|nr:hypothetical protein [Halomonas azerica]
MTSTCWHAIQNLILWRTGSALQEGIDVDDAIWARLKSLAHRILVESSEASRSGAGAGVNDND